MNEFRRDPITGRQVVIAPDRDARPNQFANHARLTGGDFNSAFTCPFCRGQMDTPPIVASYGDGKVNWEVCVVPNLYPVLNAIQGIARTNSLGLFDADAAYGLHEVVIESPSHAISTSELSFQQIVLMLHAYRDRMRCMGDQEGIKYVQVMKNVGRDAGASLAHSHSQIFGMPFVPQQLQQELDGAAQYHASRRNNGQCVYCDLIAAEEEEQSRIVVKDDHFVAWCPFASRFGFETWIAPRQHAARFEATSDELLVNLGAVFQLVMRKIEHHSRIGAFNYLLHTLPFDSNLNDHYHWHIEIIPRIAEVAGFEWGTGVHINTIAPEQSAKALRLI